MPTLKCKASYKWISIYGPGRRPATPPWCPPPATTGPPPWGWPSHLRPSVKISCAILTCWPRATYTLITSNYQTGYLHAVFTTAYMLPIQSIYNVLLSIKYLYSSHILATIKISFCYTYVLATYYLYTIYMIPL